MLLGLLSRAGFDLRVELVEAEDHDRILAEWEDTLDAESREALRRRGYRLVSDVA